MNMNIRKSQGGFTLIELVIVIVILGILAAVAVPRFIDLSTEAEEAAVAGVAGAMASAMAINFAGCAANDHDATNANCVTVNACANVNSIMQGGTAVDGYTVTGTIGTTNGTTGVCTVTSDRDTDIDATFQGIAAGNS